MIKNQLKRMTTRSPATHSHPALPLSLLTHACKVLDDYLLLRRQAFVLIHPAEPRRECDMFSLFYAARS